MRLLRLLALWIALALLWLPRAQGEAPVEARGSAREQNLEIAETLAGVELGTRMSVFEDPGGELDIAQVSSPAFARRFRAVGTAAPAYGLNTSAFWLRLRVENQNPRSLPWLLEVAYPHLDHVDLYVPNGDGSYRVKKRGDRLPFAQRDLRYRTFLFTLDESAHSARTYYMRVQTSGSANLPLLAWTSLALLDHQARELSGFFLFYGILLVMATYNLFLFFFLRQREYLYYVLYNFSLLLFQFTIHGHTFQYLLPNQIWLANNLIPFFVGMNFVWTTLFLQVYLNLDVNFPRVNRILSGANYVFVGLSLLGLCGFYALSIRLLIVCTLASTVCSPLVAIPLARQGMRQARLYMLAWAALIAGVVAYVLRTLGVLPSNWLSEWGIQIGASLEVVLLSLALADRINGMRSNLTTLNAQLSQNVSDLKLALEQAQAGTRTKLEFLATVSHELRTPLNAIINIPGGLLRDFKHSASASCAQCASVFALEPGDEISAASVCPECAALGMLRQEELVEYHGQPEATERHLLSIERSGKHLLQMVNGILDFSKLEAGKVSLSVGEVPVQALLLDTAEPLEELARRAGVKLSVEAPDGSLMVLADGLRLKQVLINLISNAIKFSDRRGTVFVSVQSASDGYRFAVRDQGIGIAAENLETVFGSFEQVQQPGQRRFGGTGLGLFISRSLVRKHGGEMWVESTLGQGATFRFHIPRRERARSTANLRDSQLLSLTTSRLY